jgi:hypothetical protein
MEQQSAYGGGLAALSPVDRVAEDGVPQMGEMNADLVGAPGVETADDQ